MTLSGGIATSGPQGAAPQAVDINDEVREAFRRSLFALTNYGGTSDAITAEGAAFDIANLNGGTNAFLDGQIIQFTAQADNTTTTPTLAVDAVPGTTIVDETGGTLAVGDIKSGVDYTLEYAEAPANHLRIIARGAGVFGDGTILGDLTVGGQVTANGVTHTFGPTTGVSVLRRGQTDALLTLSGGSGQNVGANLQLFSESHAAANDIQLRTATTVRLEWDNSNLRWDYKTNPIVGVGSMILTSNSGIFRNVNTSNQNIAGGTAGNVGANYLLYGGAHATQAHDHVFRTGGTTRLQWDHSLLEWDYQGLDVVGVNKLELNDPNFHLELNAGDSDNPRITFDSGGDYFRYIRSASTLTMVIGSIAITNWDASRFKVNLPLQLASYTVATLPTGGAAYTAFATDETGGAVPVFHDGTNWRRVTDRAIAA